MLTLVAGLDACECDDAADRCNVYTNVDSAGNAGGDVESEPINRRPVRLFPGLDPAEEPDAEDDLDVRVEVGPVHFGRVKVGVAAVDQYGNEQAGAMAVSERTVNSTPTPAKHFTRGDFDGETGQQWFTFAESPQLAN